MKPGHFDYRSVNAPVYRNNLQEQARNAAYVNTGSGPRQRFPAPGIAATVAPFRAWRSSRLTVAKKPTRTAGDYGRCEAVIQCLCSPSRWYGLITRRLAASRRCRFGSNGQFGYRACQPLIVINLICVRSSGRETPLRGASSPSVHYDQRC